MEDGDNRMAASDPGVTDIKKLFARSGNRCAFPKCPALIFLEETLIGEVCHIKGARPGSARYDPHQTDEERHAYANLILMCANHHTVIDDDEEAYTVEHLCKIKAAHEAQSAPISEAEVATVAQLFVQSFTNVSQSGGLSAHTVNASSITVHSAPSASHLTLQRQIRAVERLWKVVGDLNKEFGQAIFVDDILTSSELDAYFKSGKRGHFADCILGYADTKLILKKFADAGANDAERERPFVSNRLWSVFFVLRGFYGRIAFLLANSFQERELVNWRNDSGCDQLLGAILPSKLVEDAKGRPIGGLRVAVHALENRFLTEAGMNQPPS